MSDVRSPDTRWTVEELAEVWTPAGQLTDEVLALWPFWIFSPPDETDRPTFWQVHASNKLRGRQLAHLVGVWRPLYVDGMDSDGSIDHDRLTKEMWAWCWWETYVDGWTPITRREASDRLGPRAPLRPRLWSILDDVGTPRDQLWRITDVTTLADFVRELPPGVMRVETADSTAGEPRPVHLLSGKLGPVWRPLDGAPVTVQPEPEPCKCKPGQCEAFDAGPGCREYDARTAREIKSSDWVPCENLARITLASSGEWLWREYEDQPWREWKILAWPDELPTHGHLRPYAPETSPGVAAKEPTLEELASAIDMGDTARVSRLVHYVRSNGDVPEGRVLDGEDDHEDFEHWVDLLLRLAERALGEPEWKNKAQKADAECAEFELNLEAVRSERNWLEAELDRVRNLLGQHEAYQKQLVLEKRRGDLWQMRWMQAARAEKLLAQEQEQHARSRAQLVRTHDALHQHLVATREIDHNHDISNHVSVDDNQPTRTHENH